MSVYFYGCITLDGYLADKNHSLHWLHETGTWEETSYTDFYAGLDVTLMGRKTFNEIASLEAPASLYPTTENYVFTHSKALPASGFIPVQGDVVGFVKALGKDKNIWVVGGNTLLAPLLDHQLVDHMILQVAPVLLGAGIPLFTQKEGLQRFTLTQVKQYGQFGELVYQKLQL